MLKQRDLQSRGGLTTKIYAICDTIGKPVEIDILPEQDTDIRQAEPMLENIDPDAFLPDRAYDADRLIDRLKERGIAVIIPPNATEQPSGKQTSLFTGNGTLASGSLIDSDVSAPSQPATTS